ncbi:hypothetical protein [Streptosporangium sp. NPDC049644]|uniref:hypothetical protein n=1 Tax=Streptosporangium sp. NPDC049644 TaxID=3155507 RepID=UPI0034154AFA
MRGQESGSEHRHEAEGSATPATPPPSFGQPSPHVPRTDLSGDEQPGSPSPWPEADPGAAQPWTVPGDDGAPYDWYAQPEDGPPLSTAPIVPGAPPWYPPPAFTAAAAGMQVWPSSGQEAPWPAATGEPVWTDQEETAARPGEPGDVAVWPPDAVFQEGGESGKTVDVRAASPHQDPPPQAPAPTQTGPRNDPQDVLEDSDRPVPAARPPMPAPVTQPVAHPVAIGPEPISQAPLPDTEQTAPGRTAPRPAASGPPAPLFTPAEQVTPPSGVPAVTPPFPLPAFPPPPVTSSSASEPPASPSDPAATRGPFTPLSAFTPEPPPAPPPPTRGRAGTTLLAAVVAVVVVGIGIGAFFAYQSFNAKQAANAADPILGPGKIDPTDKLDITGEPEPINTTMLNSEKTDPGKMSVADAFVKKVSVAGTTFTRVKTNLTEQCQKAATGKFAATLRSQECRRVLRATYVDSKRRYAVTTGIAVLPTRESAVAADRAKDLERNLWFRGLPSAAGTGGERVHIAGGYAAGMVWGRYIVFSYATYSDGHTPTAKEKALGKISGAFRDQTAKVVERRVTN